MDRGTKSEVLIDCVDYHDKFNGISQMLEAELGNMAQEVFAWCRENSLPPSWLSEPNETIKTWFPGMDKETHGFLSVVPVAAALFRHSSNLCIAMRHYDIQVQAALNLLAGYSIQMDTGEGKTIVIGMAAYLKFLWGVYQVSRGLLSYDQLTGISPRKLRITKSNYLSIHVATANLVLANRDALWLGPVFKVLGLSSAALDVSGDRSKNSDAYKADIVFGTLQDFGHDHLFDRLAPKVDQRKQNQLYSLIVDEADLSLVDEARTPLIVSSSFDNYPQSRMNLAREAANFADQVLNTPCTFRFDLTVMAPQSSHWLAELVDIRLSDLSGATQKEATTGITETLNNAAKGTNPPKLTVRQYETIAGLMGGGTINQKTINETYKLLLRLWPMLLVTMAKYLPPWMVQLASAKRVERTTQLLSVFKGAPLLFRSVKNIGRILVERLAVFCIDHEAEMPGARLSSDGTDSEFNEALRGRNGSEMVCQSFDRWLRWIWNPDTALKDLTTIDIICAMNVMISLGLTEQDIPALRPLWPINLWSLLRIVDGNISLSPLGRELSGARADIFLKSGLIGECDSMLFENFIRDSITGFKHLKERRDYEVVPFPTPARSRIQLLSEHTGLPMPGQRYSDPLHAIIEMKHGLPISHPSQSTEEISMRHVCKLYQDVVGLSGTLEQVATDLSQEYGSTVVVMERADGPSKRKDMNTVVFRTTEERIRACTYQILEITLRRQPVLVELRNADVSEDFLHRLSGLNLMHLIVLRWVTEEFPKSEDIAEKQDLVSVRNYDLDRAQLLLPIMDIPEHTLSAWYDDFLRAHGKADFFQAVCHQLDIPNEGQMAQRLQEILKHGVKIEVVNGLYDRQGRTHVCIQKAGDLGAVTLSAKVAGRGQDISLPDESLALGGLHVIVAEKSPVERHNIQAKGRSGRLTDPGSSSEFSSLQDEMMLNIGSQRMDAILAKVGMGPGEGIQNKFIQKAFERTQKKVARRDSELRQKLFAFDDTMAPYRELTQTWLDEALVHRHTCLLCRHPDELIDIGNPQVLCERCASQSSEPGSLLRGFMLDMVISWIRSPMQPLYRLREMVRMACPPDAPSKDWDWTLLEKDIHEEWGVKIPQNSILKSIQKTETITSSEDVERIICGEIRQAIIQNAPKKLRSGYSAAAIVETADNYTELDRLADHLNQRLLVKIHPSDLALAAGLPPESGLIPSKRKRRNAAFECVARSLKDQVLISEDDLIAAISSFENRFNVNLVDAGGLNTENDSGQLLLDRTMDRISTLHMQIAQKLGKPLLFDLENNCLVQAHKNWWPHFLLELEAARVQGATIVDYKFSPKPWSLVVAEAFVRYAHKVSEFCLDAIFNEELAQ